MKSRSTAEARARTGERHEKFACSNKWLRWRRLKSCSHFDWPLERSLCCAPEQSVRDREERTTNAIDLFVFVLLFLFVLKKPTNRTSSGALCARFRTLTAPRPSLLGPSAQATSGEAHLPARISPTWMSPERAAQSQGQSN